MKQKNTGKTKGNPQLPLFKQEKEKPRENRNVLKQNSKENPGGSLRFFGETGKTHNLPKTKTKEKRGKTKGVLEKQHGGSLHFFGGGSLHFSQGARRRLRRCASARRFSAAARRRRSPSARRRRRRRRGSCSSARARVTCADWRWSGTTGKSSGYSCFFGSFSGEKGGGKSRQLRAVVLPCV